MLPIYKTKNIQKSYALSLSLINFNRRDYPYVGFDIKSFLTISFNLENFFWIFLDIFLVSYWGFGTKNSGIHHLFCPFLLVVKTGGKTWQPTNKNKQEKQKTKLQSICFDLLCWVAAYGCILSLPKASISLSTCDMQVSVYLFQ